MALASISLRGFRNLDTAAIDFDRGANYLFGPNGAGKTNLLEAIHYLAIGRSFRRCPDAELLRFDDDILVVSGTDEEGERAEIRFDGREKRVLRNDIPVEKLSEYFGWLPIVVLLLEDIDLVRGAPVVRRGYVDLALAKAESGLAGRANADSRRQGSEGQRGDEGKSYIALMGEYRRSVVQYNRLLVKGEEGRDQGEDELAAWEEELVRTGVPVYEARLVRVAELLQNAAQHYRRLAGQKAEFSYRSSVGDAPDIAAAFRQRLAKTRERARAFGHVLVGPHRDDIRIMRGERELRKFGSIGEQRLAGIALRLAEADMLLGARGQRPVFLLDEVASELDEQRSRLALEMVSERGQMVYAAARRIVPQLEKTSDGSAGAVRDGSALDHLTTGPLEHSPGKEFHVEAGTVSEVP